MSHWAEGYVGRPFVEGEFDCGELARVVMKEQFGRDVAVPTERWYQGKEGAARLRAMAGQVQAVAAELGTPTWAPKEGDAVLMYSGSKRMHVGVYCLIGAEVWVLHCAERAGQVILTRFRELEPKGFRLEGVYAWT